MTGLPAHTPYSGSSIPFTIGLRPATGPDWLEIDRYYPDMVAEKDRLIAAKPDEVFAAEPGTEAAQDEAARLIGDAFALRLEKLPPDLRDLVERRRVSLASCDEAPLQRIARSVQEDLVLMRRGDDGWRLAAASLCFPSSWSLREKFGKPLTRIHTPVPGFGPGSRNDRLVERIFDGLQVELPVERLNWSLQADPERHKPMTTGARGERGRVRPSRFPDRQAAKAAFVRVERQTLRKLPRSGDILFSIRIHVDPLGALRDHPARRTIAASFASQLRGLDGSQLDYKGLTADREALAAALDELQFD